MYRPARGGRSCERFGGYKTINRIPLPLHLRSFTVEERYCFHCRELESLFFQDESHTEMQCPVDRKCYDPSYIKASECAKGIFIDKRVVKRITKYRPNMFWSEWLFLDTDSKYIAISILLYNPLNAMSTCMYCKS